MDNAGLFLMSKEGVMALLTGFFTLLSLVLFIKGFLKGKTKPYLWAWVVRLGICIVAFLSQIAQGATYSLALALGQIFCGLCIIALLIYTSRTKMGRLDTVDWAAIAIAGTGVLLWITSGNPLFSILGVILADACATTMGIRAAVQKGSSESVPFWSCALLAAGTAVLSAKNASWSVLLAPLFGCANATANILAATYVKRRHRTASGRLRASPSLSLAAQEE